MATNVYFNNYSYGREQDLVEDLVIEAIRMYGYDVKYLPRDTTSVDSLFGEDPLASFDIAADIEMYVKNVEGFEGEGEFLSKFNIEIRDEITFTVARKRWDQIASEKILLETGSNMLTESANTGAPSRQFLSDSDNQYENFVLDTANAYSISTNRPYEGDIIYFPLTRKLYQIKFVEHEEIFYQTGRLQTYDLRCELFEYSSEQFNTGDATIDAISGEEAVDTLIYEFLLEDDTGVLLDEQGGSLLQEYRIETTQPSANNEYFTIKQRDEVIDFSESNPFGDFS